jgi:cytochrome c5
MTHKILPFALLAGAALVSLGVQAKVPMTLKSVTVTLPVSTRALPDGPGQAVAHDNCLTCHSAGMILNQPAMTKTSWEAEVNKMRSAYKAPVDAKDVPAIVDYLTAIKGSK